MAQVHVDGDTLIVEIEGLDKLWAFKSRLEIPLPNVRGATADPGAIKEPKGIRAAGAGGPRGIRTTESIKPRSDPSRSRRGRAWRWAGQPAAASTADSTPARSSGSAQLPTR